MNHLFTGGKDSWHKWWDIWGTNGIWEGYEEGDCLLQGMNVRSHDPQSMFNVGHMTHNQSTILNCVIVWFGCMTFWGKFEQAGYVDFPHNRLTLVAMVPYNWLGHSCLITHIEVCSFIFIIVELWKLQ